MNRGQSPADGEHGLVSVLLHEKRAVERLPVAAGTYALLLHLPVGQPLQVGRLGRFTFPAGYYLYLGSALGPGGLAARLGRHLRPTRVAHWHIDHLRVAAEHVEAWFSVSPTRAEHAWAAAAGRLDGAAVPVSRFGASDCRCPAHLYHYGTRPALAAFATELDRTAAVALQAGRAR